MSDGSRVTSQVWVDHGEVFDFPELAIDSVAQRPNAGVCFSGGGTRSMSACIGYLRGLTQLGLLDRVRYISSVSGGSWASSIFTYYCAGTNDDAMLLGSSTAPEQLTLERIERTPEPGSMAAVAAHSFIADLGEHLVQFGSGIAWNLTVGDVYLAPFGLFEHQRARALAFNEATRDTAIARNPAHLRAEDFVLPRPGRPFLVINSCLVAPARHEALLPENPVTLQFTPLYAGSPLGRTLTFKRYLVDPEHEQLPVGGGFVEPFAFGGQGPQQIVPNTVAELDLPEPLSDLAFAVGSSSAAYAGIIDKLPILKSLRDLTPSTPYWPVRAGEVPPTQLWDVADGGVLENYGLLALLQRRVEKIVVFVNTDAKLDPSYRPFVDDPHHRIDAFLPPLFGAKVEVTGAALQNNQVFARTELDGLVSELAAAKARGGPVVVVCRHEVLDNEWWGIRGGWSVEIAWVYLDRVPRWEAALPPETRDEIARGNDRLAHGKLEYFPNYKTIGENACQLLELSPAQVHLAADLAAWVVTESEDVLTALLGR